MKLLCVLLLVTSCATTQRAGTAGKHAAIQCGKQYGPTVASALARWGAESAIAGKLDTDALETTAKGLGLGAGSCFVGEVLRAWKALQPVGVAALAGDADAVTQIHAVLARVSGGAQVVLADGTVVQ